MDAFPTADQTPVASLLRSAVQQARESGQRHRERADVREIDGKRIAADLYILSFSNPKVSR